MISTQRDQLVTTLENTGRDMENLIKTAGEARLNEPGVTGEWSVKDLLAHCAAWEERILAWAEALPRGTHPSPAPWTPGLSEEQINAFIYENHRHQPVSEVLAHWREVHQGVIDVVKSMSDEDLFSKKVDWLNGSFADRVPGNSSDHIQEHARQIQSWLDAQ
ncbi:MAG: ClbS/DfsB family four-helix bundle protein [Omnitrophica WOR_2 bacterium]